MKTNFFSKNLFIVMLGVLLTATLLIIFKNRTADKTLTIGILQTISHTALDNCRNGLMEELEKTFGKNIRVKERNAQGSMLTAQTIAKSFHCDKQISGIVSIGTLATQAITQIEKQKPIFFCAVTDPQKFGLTNNQINSCGVSDAVDVDKAIQTLQALAPNAKNIAIIFNPAEANSECLVNQMDEKLKQKDLIPVHIGVNNETEVQTAAIIATQKADALLIPTDNTVACVMNIIGEIALKSKKPLFICDSLLISKGILAASGSVNYKECGKLTAKLIEQVFCKKQMPNSLAVIFPKSNSIVMHKLTAEKLNIKVPEDLVHKIEWVN
jgi:putative ABC transport system substrate-binding protein